MKKIAVILSGSGVYDGAEIHEATFTMYEIAKQGAGYQVFAPNVMQHHVVNHITGAEMNEKRNVLIESARIARGNVKNLAELKTSEFDAIILPGGFGVAKNLSTFAFEGANCSVNEELSTVIKQIHAEGKPIGALCISPVVVAKVLENVEITIGQDEETAKAVENMGATHKNTTHGEVIIDNKNKIITTPCYMLDANIVQIADGAKNIVTALLSMTN